MARKPQLSKVAVKKDRKPVKCSNEDQQTPKNANKKSLPTESGSEENFENTVEDKKKPVKKDLKTKVFYTPDNINTFLLEYDQAANHSRLFGLLAYIFKTFSENPAELLAKIKILTRKMKVNQTHPNIQSNILEHVFALFKISGDFYECMFKLLKNNGFVTKIVSEFFFKTPMESNEAFEEVFDKIVEMLISKLDPIATVKFSDFKSTAEELNGFENLNEFKIENGECSRESCDSEHSVSEDEMNNEELSSMSLISLDDDSKIAELDNEMGKLFKRSDLATEDVGLVANVFRCLEHLVKFNYASQIDKAYILLYFYQFVQFQQQVKFIVKPFIAKFSDKKELFRIFQISSIIIPHVHGLYSVFLTDLKESFNLIEYIRIALKFNQSSFIFHRIESRMFYDLYSPSLGEAFDDFYISLISKESNLELLTKLNEKEDRPNIKEAIQASIDRISSNIKSKEKFEKKKSSAKKDVTETNNSKEQIVEESHESLELSDDEEISDNDVEEFAEQSTESEVSVDEEMLAKHEAKANKKKSFAQKIGKKLFEKKQANRKLFKGSKGDDEKLSEKDLKKKHKIENKKNKDAYKMALSENKKSQSKKFSKPASKSGNNKKKQQPGKNQRTQKNRRN